MQPTPSLKRVYDGRLPVEQVAGTAKEYFGNLRRLAAPENLKNNQVSDFVNRTNRLLHSIHERGPGDPLNRIAWQCAMFRGTALQVTRSEYLAHSAIGADRFLIAVEEGHGHRREVTKLLREWLAMAESTGDPEIIRQAEHAREELRVLLYSDRRDTVAAHLLGLIAKHGEDIAVVTRKTLEVKVQDEDPAVMPRSFHNYMKDAYAFARESDREMHRENPCTEERPDSMAYWDHPYVRTLRTNYLHGALGGLRHEGRPAGKPELLCEYLRMLMAIADERTGRDEFMAHYQAGRKDTALISVSDQQRMAREFSRNNPPPTAVVERMLGHWVERRIIPQTEADSLLHVWKKWEGHRTSAAKEGSSEGATVGQDLYAGIETLAKRCGFKDPLLLLKVLYTGFMKGCDDAIRFGQITRSGVPLYPALCARWDQERDIEHAVRLLHDEHAARPSNKGMRYGDAYWRMGIYGIATEDLPETIRPASIAVYASEESNPPSEQLLALLDEMGQAKAAESLRKFNACFAPRTVEEAGAYPVAKFSALLDVCGPGKAVSSPDVFYRLAGDEQRNVQFKNRGAVVEKKEVFNLSKLRQLIRGTNADFTRELLIDWYVKRAGTSGYAPLGRALDVMMGEVTDSATDLYVSLREPPADRLSEKVCSDLFTAAKRGEDFKTERSGSKEDRLRQFLRSIGEDPTSPRGLFLQCVLVRGNMPDALSDWCGLMRESGRDDLVWGLLEHRRQSVEPRVPTLEDRLHDKRAILERLDRGEIGAVFDDKDDVVVSALKSVPGVTIDDLKKWNPPFRDIAPPANVLQYTAVTDALTGVGAETQNEGTALREEVRAPLSVARKNDADANAEIGDVERGLLGLLMGPRVDVHSQRFNRWFETARALFGTVFPEDRYPGASGLICQSADELRAALETTPDLQREYAIELMSMLIDQRESAKGFNGKKPYMHQESYLFAAACAIARSMEGGLSILFDASAGSGKTLLQGCSGAAFRNGQRRGVIDPSLKVVMLTAKEAFENQQLMDEHARHAVVFSVNPEDITQRERRDHHEFLLQELRRITGGDDVSKLFPDETTFAALYDRLPADSEEAHDVLRAALQKSGITEAWGNAADSRLRHQAAALLSRHGTIVVGPDHRSLQYLDITRPTEQMTVPEALATGDLTFGFGDDTPIYLRRDNRETDQDLSGFQAVCLSHIVAVQDRFQKERGELFRAGLYLLDEARSYSHSFFEQLARAGGVENFIAIASTARDQGPKSGGSGLSRFNVMMPHFLESDAINGPDKVSQPSTMAVFPGKDETHYPSGSYEHGEQLVQAYGKLLQLPLQRDQGRMTLSDGLHIITVPRNLVPYVTIRLGQMYPETGIDFVSYTANRLDANIDLKFARQNRMQALMCDPTFQRRCFVGTMSDFIDSLDPRRAVGVIMSNCEHHGDGETIRRYYGRGNHSAVPGWLFAQHRLSNPQTFNNMVYNVYPPETERNPPPQEHEQVWSVVDGQTMWGRKEVARDEEAILRGNYDKTEIVVSKKTAAPMPVPCIEGELPAGKLEEQIEAGQTSPAWIAEKAAEVRARMGLAAQEV